MTNEQTREILDILTQDARTAPDLIAAMLGLDITEVAGEIRRLEESDIILKYSAIINEEKTETPDTVHALIEVSVSPQAKLGYEDIADMLCRYDEVRSCYLMSGSYDYILEVFGKNLREVARFVAEKLAPIDGVTATSTHFVLRKYKDNGVTMPGADMYERQVVTP